MVVEWCERNLTKSCVSGQSVIQAHPRTAPAQAPKRPAPGSRAKNAFAPASGFSFTEVVAIAAETLEARLSPPQSPKPPPRAPRAPDQPDDPDAPGAPEAKVEERLEEERQATRHATEEIERVRAQLADERRRHLDTSRRVNELIDQLRDEQERADDFRVQLSMKNVDFETQLQKRREAELAEKELLAAGSPAKKARPSEMDDFDFDDFEHSMFLSKYGSMASRGRLAESLENSGVEVVRKAREPAVNSEDLQSCFFGTQRVEPTLPGVIAGSAPRGEGFEEQYSWILALSLPNPRAGNALSLRPSGIGAEEAGHIFDACFSGEELSVGDGHTQALRKVTERMVFMKAFAKLPDVETHKTKRYAGVEPPESTFWTENPACAASSFLELLRNAMVTKITMHCHLPVRTCATEDSANVIVLVSACAKDLLLEADRSKFPTELDISTTDPASLEPCCPKTYYPLLTYYRDMCPHAPNMEVQEAVELVIEAFADAPDELKAEKKAELVFWAAYDSDQASAQELSPTSRKSVRARASQILHARESEHTYSSSRMRALMLRAFLRYLQLKAEGGLAADSRELMHKVNKELGRQVLVNWHTAVGLPFTAAPYKAFRLDQYQGSEEWKRCWKMYSCRSRDVHRSITTPFSGNERVKLLECIIARQIDVAQMESLGLVSSIFPLDARDKIERTDPGFVGEPSELALMWGMPTNPTFMGKALHFARGLWGRTPLDAARNYYGERIAFYFGLVDTICWLLVPASIFGAFTFGVHQLLHYDPRTDLAPFTRVCVDLSYACFIALWGTIVLEVWKRRQVVLALQWGQRGISKVEEPRPQFIGIMRRSPVTYEDNEVYYSSWKRLRWQLLSISVLVTLASIEAVGTVYTGQLRGTWVMNQWPMHKYAQQFTALIEDFQMGMFSKIGLWLSIKLNDAENLRTGTSYMNGLVNKVVIHELWNRFHLYFYVAFVKALREGCVVRDESGRQFLMPPEGMNDRMCYEELATQVTTVLIVEFMKNAIEVVKPLLKAFVESRLRPAPEIIAVDEEKCAARMAHFCQEAMERPLYGMSLEIDGTFFDYLEITILFGHMTLFSLVFPLAPAMGFILLSVELKVDGFKLFELVRRPLPRNAEDIGNWFNMISALTWTAMFTNGGLVVFTMGAFDDPPGYFGNLPRWVYFVFLAGTMCMIKILAGLIIPDIPEEISVAEEHHDFLRGQVDTRETTPVERQAQEVLDLAALDLSIDHANTGQFREPQEFGITPQRLLRRVDAIKRRRDRAQRKATKSKPRKTPAPALGAGAAGDGDDGLTDNMA